jgi:hypothetical protein
MQVFRHGAGGYWRASKRWCKTLPVELVDKALLSFAHNGESVACLCLQKVRLQSVCLQNKC